MNLTKENYRVLDDLNNKYVEKIVLEAAELCKPDKISILNGSSESLNYIRNLAIKKNEEISLELNNHTCHFDGYYDQGRDKYNTKYLIDKNTELNKNNISRTQGLKEIYSDLEGSMKGKEMFVKFYTLGPKESEFSIPALQITDSSYVVHSEDILYRQGYMEFKDLDKKQDFFYFLHSSGKLENNVSTEIDKRKVYIDLKENSVYSLNTQYAGNSLGLKKLAFRLAIKKATQENWLAEHMFISAVQDENENKTYFAGAFPSGCGKTSTAMIPGLKIVGDDLAYLKNFNGNMRAVNVEKGIFGIIKDINPNNNPIIYNALTSPNEVIFSNILINNGAPYWLGMDKEKPEKGINFSGKWFKDKTDNEGDKIPFAHENARFTLKIKDVKNCDKNYDSKDGVHIKGIIFGGRDSDTSVPVAETFSWNHGVFNGAILESETTAATLGETAKRKHNPMAIYDFLSVPIDEYIKNYINFGNKLENPPKIFTVNYFLKDNQTKNFLNDISDKKIWLLWMEGRVNNKYTAIKTPVGYIPNYKDLKGLFNKHLNKFYKKEDYLNQFSIRINKTLDKLNRIEKEYLNMYDLPLEKTFLELTRLPIEFLEQLKQQRKLLKTAKKKYNKGIITPDKFAK